MAAEDGGERHPQSTRGERLVLLLHGFLEVASGKEGPSYHTEDGVRDAVHALEDGILLVEAAEAALDAGQCIEAARLTGQVQSKGKGG